MTIQRQYSLPNCRLVLEGWGDNAEATSNFMEGRPIMTILVNAECHFSGQDKPLAGGREFLDHLAMSVNQYAQQVLSGVPHYIAQSNGKTSLISLHQTDKSHHRLTLRAAHGKDEPSDNNNASDIQLDLSTVQLFDLVEAIDQMVADAQTLPDMYLDLTPVSKRGVSSQEPVARRVVPAALGISGFAVAAIALFFVPTPEFEPTEPEAETTEETTDGASTNPIVPGTEPDPTREPTSETGENSDQSESSSLSSDDSSSSNESSDTSQDSGASLDELPTQEDIEELFTSATPIVDSDKLTELTSQLRTQIVDAWDQNPTFEEELEYRVGVSEAGEIVGFKFVNDASLTHEAEVPLRDLTFFPIDPDVVANAPIGQFKVVFRPNGVVEVSPWYGRPPGTDE